MQFIEDELRLVADSVTLTVLNLPLDRDFAPAPRFDQEQSQFCTRINMIGQEWNGCFQFVCSRGFARKAASALFQKEMDAVSILEEQDAVGELANMIAGGIKPELPNHVMLDLPEADNGPIFSHVQGRILTRLHLSCAGEQFEIALYDKGE